MAVVQAPRALPRVVRVPASYGSNPYAFVFLSSIIHAHIDQLFPGMRQVDCYQFRVTRDSDLLVDEEAVDDLLMAVEGRAFFAPLRPGGAAGTRRRLSEGSERGFLAKEFDLDDADVFRCNGPVNLMRLNRIPDLVDRPDLKYPGFTPSIPPRLQRAHRTSSPPSAMAMCCCTIRSSRSCRCSTSCARRPTDPGVVSIRQTLYRTGTDSNVVEALVDAARNGKEVLVVIELRARFDEQANIELANDLQEAGAQVVYGVVGYKTHAKMLMVLRREGNRLRRYVHLGTGNYHARTARLYTDYGLLTADEEIAHDVQQVFHQLTTMGRVDQAQQGAAGTIQPAPHDPRAHRHRNRKRPRRQAGPGDGEDELADRAAGDSGPLQAPPKRGSPSTSSCAASARCARASRASRTTSACARWWAASSNTPASSTSRTTAPRAKATPASICRAPTGWAATSSPAWKSASPSKTNNARRLDLGRGPRPLSRRQRQRLGTKAGRQLPTRQRGRRKSVRTGTVVGVASAVAALADLRWCSRPPPARGYHCLHSAFRERSSK